MEYKKVYRNQEKEDRSELTIIFNGKYFSINRWNYNTDCYNDDEYLPGIHINIHKKYSENESQEIIHEYRQSNNLFYRLFLLIKKYRLDKVIEKKQEVTILLEVKNKRDDIVILDHKEIIFENEKPYQDPLNKKFGKVKDESNCGKSYTEFKNVATSKIMYPFQSGGWGNRCIMKQVFGDLDLFHTCHSKYRFFEENEMHYTVSQVEYLRDICSSKGLCSRLLEKFRTGSYVVSREDEWSDDICLEEKNGVYEISNANHRVCCAKMFKIPFVKARVYKVFNHKEKDNLYDNDVSNIYISRIHTRYEGNLTKDYYNILYKLGLNMSQAYEILEKGLRGKVFIDYIEKVTGKNILDLHREINK